MKPSRYDPRPCGTPTRRRVPRLKLRISYIESQRIRSGSFVKDSLDAKFGKTPDVDKMTSDWRRL